jgi:riboflavin biosynthesis pyrimidine reductase
MTYRQLLPEPGQVEVPELLAELELSGRALADRPYAVANFVASADGRATFHGRSGQLGDDGDRQMFHGLREQVDAVLVGTGTLAVERYGRMIPDAERRERRVARGLEPEPLTCVITRSGRIPAGLPLLDVREARLLVFSGDRLALGDFAATVDVIERDPAELTNTAVLEFLRTELGIRSLLCEGGPTLLGALVREWLLDELFLTVAPRLAGGGTGPTITDGPELPDVEQLELLWALERAGSLFLRYGLR